MRRVQVYGPIEPSSFSVVSDGIAKGLREHGLSVLREPTTAPPLPADVTVVVSTDLSHVRAAKLTSERVVLLVAPNSLGIHPAWADEVLHGADGQPLVDQIAVPSYWASKVADEHLPGIPLVITPHGAEPAARAVPERHAWEVWHIVTTPRRRKGTEELLQAWAMVQTEGSVDERFTLVLRVNYRFLSIVEGWWEAAGSPPRVRLEPSQMLDHESACREMAERAALVVAPSRCEAFGLVPIEALMMGIPGVATFGSGHMAWWAAFPGEPLWGAVGALQHVPLGFDAPSDDYPGATAPSVLPEHIANALEKGLRVDKLTARREYLLSASQSAVASGALTWKAGITQLAEIIRWWWDELEPKN